MEKREGEIIIDCGVEGGTWTLLGTKVANGWRFCTIRNEFAMYDYLDEEDRGSPEEYWSESDWVDSWEEATALFNKYTWHLFYTVQLHPEFKR